MSLILNLYLIGISGKSERMRYSNNSNYEVIRRQDFINIMDANLNEYHERVVLSNDIIIKVYSSDREDGCPKNSVNILYWRKFTDSFYILPFHQHLGNYHVYVNTSYM